MSIPPLSSQNAYCDYKSVEQFTNKEGKKYKLLGNIINLPPLLLLYPFFILTKRESSCQKDLRVCIRKSDWENREPSYLTEERSYIDIKKMETLNKDKLFEKIKDSENGFPLVARLCDVRFGELKGKLSKLNRARSIQKRQSELIQCALADANIAKKILKKLLLD